MRLVAMKIQQKDSTEKKNKLKNKNSPFVSSLTKAVTK